MLSGSINGMGDCGGNVFVCTSTKDTCESDTDRQDGACNRLAAEALQNAGLATLTVTSWNAVCGACDDGKGNAVACPTDPDVVKALLHVPADALVEERIVEVEGPGKEQRFSCGE